MTITNSAAKMTARTVRIVRTARIAKTPARTAAKMKARTTAKIAAARIAATNL